MMVSFKNHTSKTKGYLKYFVYAFFCAYLTVNSRSHARASYDALRESRHINPTNVTTTNCQIIVTRIGHIYSVPQSYLSKNATPCSKAKSVTELEFNYMMPSLEAVETQTNKLSSSDLAEKADDVRDSSYIVFASIVENGSLRDFPPSYDIKLKNLLRHVCEPPAIMHHNKLQQLTCSEGDGPNVLRYYSFTGDDASAIMRCATDKSTGSSGYCQSNVWYHKGSLRAFIQFPAMHRHMVPNIASGALELLLRWKK